MLFPHVLFMFSLGGYPEIFSNASDCVFKLFGNVAFPRLNIACHLARKIILLVLWPLSPLLKVISGMCLVCHKVP